MAVSIVRANLTNIDEKLAESLRLIGYTPSRKKVLIKPNLVHSISPRSGKITHPRFTEALIKFFEPLCEEILIGEGSAVGHDTKEVFRFTGYTELARRYGVRLVDFNDCERIERPWKFGELSLPKLLAECEYVNAPIMRTHAQTGITAGIKNQKGLLLPRDKKNFHRLGLHEPIRELLNVIQPDLTVVDAIICLEGNVVGFRKSKKKLGLVIAGRDVVEVDNSCMRIMGIDSRAIEHVPAKEPGDTKGVSLDEIRTKFLPAESTRQFWHAKFHLGGCSGCNLFAQQALLSILRSPPKLLVFLWKGILKGTFVITGPDDVGELESEARIVCIGDCAKKLWDQHGGAFVPGCPPGIEDIIKAILEREG